MGGISNLKRPMHNPGSLHRVVTGNSVNFRARGFRIRIMVVYQNGLASQSTVPTFKSNRHFLSDGVCGYSAATILSFVKSFGHHEPTPLGILERVFLFFVFFFSSSFLSRTKKKKKKKLHRGGQFTESLKNSQLHDLPYLWKPRCVSSCGTYTEVCISTLSTRKLSVYRRF